MTKDGSKVQSGGEPGHMGEMIVIHQQAGGIQVYSAAPQKRGRYRGSVIITHDLWGLTEQTKRVADRFAAQGYLALAPDLYSTDKQNRRPSEQLQKDLFSPNEHTRYAAMPRLRALLAPTQTTQFKLMVISRLESCFEYLYNQPLVHQKVSMVGFGLGGTYALELALREHRLRGVVVFYGHAPAIQAELRHISCPVLAFYGSKETALAKTVKTTALNMLQAGVEFDSIVYEGAGHDFFNEDNSFAYNKQAAEDTWRRMLGFVNEQSVI